MMRIGVFMQLGENICGEIRRMAGYGFRSAQINNMYGRVPLTDALARDIRTVCRECDFEITAMFASWSGYCSFAYPEMYRTIGLTPRYLRERRMRDILEGAEFADLLGVKNVFTHIGYLPDDPEDPDRQEIKTVLRHIAATLGKRGQSLQIETGEMIPLSLALLITDIGLENVGVNFDTANFVINGRANPCDALDMLAPWVRGVHAKDAVPPRLPEPKGRQVPIGEGAVDFPRIVEKLKAAGYGGDITIEREISGERQTRDILAARDYLNKLV